MLLYPYLVTHLRNKIYILLILITFSCSESKEKETERTEMRKLTVFELDSLIYKSEYELTIQEKDSFITYSYRNKTDPNKNKEFRYLKYSDLLFAGPSEFYKIESDKFPKIFGFELYHSDPRIMDAMGPVMFNKEYGVLGFDNGMLTQYYFTNEETDKIELPILYKSEGAESNLEGIWKSTNLAYNSEIHFYENNVWKRILINYKNDTLTEKGKFTIAKDSAILPLFWFTALAK